MCSSIVGRHEIERTTSRFQVVASDICTPEIAKTEFHYLHMAWVLMSDRKGHSRPRMHWVAD